MQNFVLLRAVGRSKKPVLLKRGLSNTIDELLMAAEYVLSSGNPNLILCERGIRTFETATRNTLDLSAVPVIQERTHLPIIVDPSHGTGHRSLVRPMAVAGAAVGADGIIIEVHPDPPTARSDSEQSLSFPEFGDLMDDLRRHEYLRRPTAPHALAHIEPPVERKRLRARIDDVDSRIAALIEERAELSVAVQQTRDSDDHGHDVSRERELIEKAAHGPDGVLTPEEREMVFGAILRVSRAAQRRGAAADAAVAGGAGQ
jgi:chorismate mutase